MSRSSEASNNKKERSPEIPTIQPYAITSLIVAISEIVFPFFGLAGIIFGIIALQKIRKEPSRYTGKGLAQAGIVTGSILFGIRILLIIYLVYSFFDLCFY